MRPATSALLLAVSILATTCVAVADDSSVGLTITSDRNPSNFAIPKDIKYQFNGAHTFRDGLILGGSFQYADPTFRDGAIQNLEGTIG